MIHLLIEVTVKLGYEGEYYTLCGGEEDEFNIWESTTSVQTFFRVDDRCPDCEGHEDFGLVLLGAV